MIIINNSLKNSINSFHSLQIWSMIIWKKDKIDIIYISYYVKNKEIEFIIFIKTNLSKWIEKYIIKIMNSKNIMKCIYKNIIYRHECFWWMVLNDKSENFDLTKALLKKYRIKWLILSQYIILKSMVLSSMTMIQ